MASSIAQTPQLPAESPFLNPGHPTPLRYHYFWPMMCGLAADLAGGAVSTRAVVTAGTIWAGAALLCVIALYLSFFYNLEPQDWKSYTIGFALLGVTGLDIIPVLAHDSVTLIQSHRMFPTVEWWNEQVTGWLDASLWVPHNVTSLVAVLTAFLLLWRATTNSASEAAGTTTTAVSQNSTTKAKKKKHGRGGKPKTQGSREPTVTMSHLGVAMMAGAALASAAGMSIYVALVFGMFLVVWTSYLLKREEYGNALVFMASGSAALILAATFLRELSTSGVVSGVTSRFPVTLTVRDFGPILWLQRALKPVPPGWPTFQLLLNLFLLPLNYFLELGFFLYAGWIYWRRHRERGAFERRDLAAAAMLAISVAACTFLRSNLGDNNDLAWRGFMIAQFVLLLWAVQVLRGRVSLKSSERRTLAVLLAIGVASTVYDLTLMRFYMPLLDAAPHFVRDVLDPDGRLGERTYAMAEGYSWIREHTPPATLVQPNPGRFWDDHDLYTERREGVLMPSCTQFGLRRDECESALAAVYPYFSGTAPEDGLAGACRALRVDVLIVRDLDLVWRNKESWVWRDAPVYSNEFLRVFACHPDAGSSAAGQALREPNWPPDQSASNGDRANRSR
jgi:hypothetical protein